MITELMSTLAQRHLGSFASSHHRVRMALTERPLSWRQARYPVADDAGAECYDRRQRPVQEKENVEVEDSGRDADTPRRTVVATAADETTRQRPN